LPDDLADWLDELRRWSAVVEKRPGVGRRALPRERPGERQHRAEEVIVRD